MTALEAQVGRLAEIGDQNTHMFVESLKTLEAMQLIQRRIMNDIVNNKARCIGDAEVETGHPVRTQTPAMVDFVSYVMEYDICQTFAGFVQWLANLAPKEQLVQQATDTDVIEFGG